MEKECEYCKEKFSALLKEVKRGHGKYCSRVCFGKKQSQKLKDKAKEKRTEATALKCPMCSKMFWRSKSKINVGKHNINFCSRPCKDFGQRLGGIKEIQPPHYGNGEHRDYRKLALNNLLNKCGRCGYNKHKEVLEVHHKDRDRSNNKLENLEILCPTCHRENHFLKQDGIFWKNKMGDGAVGDGHFFCKEDNR